MSSEHKLTGRLLFNARSGMTETPELAEMPAPFLLEMDPESNILQPAAIGPEGLAVRVPAFEGMRLGQLITVYWRYSLVEYSTQAEVTKVGHFVDVRLPRTWLEQAAPAGGASIRYEVSGFAEGSPSTSFLIGLDFPPNPRLLVPGYPEGVFDPSLVPAPGLGLLLPEREYLWPMWCSYGRDGRRIATLYFPTVNGGLMYVAPDILALTEPEGDVWLSYAGRNDVGNWVESPFTRLRVVG
jgi:hypothetical protein